MNGRFSVFVVTFRILHGLFAVYFILCLGYLYLVGFTGVVNGVLFRLAVVSLAAEGVAVFVFNHGDCPLVHVQRRIGDNKPFFELLLPPKIARHALPFFGGLTIVAILVVLLRFVPN